MAFATEQLHGQREAGDAPRQRQQLLGAKPGSTVSFNTDTAPGSPRPPPPVSHHVRY